MKMRTRITPNTDTFSRSEQGIHFSTLEIQIKMILISLKSSEKFTDILESSCPKIFGNFWEELQHC